MKEADWGLPRPADMLGFIGDKISNRKLRLIGCAFCRQAWHLLIDPRSQNAVVVAEQFADDIASQEQLTVAQTEASRALGLWPRFKVSTAPWEQRKFGNAAMAAQSVARTNTGGKFQTGVQAARQCLQVSLSAAQSTTEVVRQLQSDVIRDIAGDPFSLESLHPSWISSTVLSIARHIYDDSDYTAMPILGDALEDAGCDKESILRHCRLDAKHFRGCWVVDAILGRK